MFGCIKKMAFIYEYCVISLYGIRVQKLEQNRGDSMTRDCEMSRKIHNHAATILSLTVRTLNVAITNYCF
jgi:hypothetical protein